MNVRRYRGFRLLLSLLACVCGWTALCEPAALAQDYQDLVQQGLREFELGNFSEAKAFFQQAHQLSPNARTLRGLGMASYELRHYVEAIDDFQKALTSKERPLTPQMHAEVSRLLTQARSFVTRLKLRVTPSDAQLRLDTRELFRDSDGSILLDPGSHELVADAADYETVTRSIRGDVGETLSLTLTLHSTATVAEPLTPPAAHTAGSSSIAPYIVIGVSTALAIAGGVLLAVALNNKHAVENTQPTADGPRYADYQDRAVSVLPLSAAGIAGLALGLAGVAAGVTWKLTYDERATTTALALSPGGLTLSGQF